MEEFFEQRQMMAIELFQEAGLQEQAGNLGKAITLYSRAYRLDPNVNDYAVSYQKDKEDQKYEAEKSTFRPVNLALMQEIAQIQSMESGPLFELPSDALFQIVFQLGLFNIQSLERLARCCSRSYLLCRSELLWKKLYVKKFPLKKLFSPRLTIPTRLLYIYTPNIRTDGFYCCRISYFRAVPIDECANYHPVTCVTYYRYLRVWQDGQCLAWVTTDEPSQSIADLLKQPPSSSDTNDNSYNKWPGMFVGEIEQESAQHNTWQAHFEPTQNGRKYIVQMRFQASSSGKIPKTVSGLTRPALSLRCLAYHALYAGELTEFDCTEWGKFVFYRVRSYT